jgi:hypothetical protein
MSREEEASRRRADLVRSSSRGEEWRNVIEICSSSPYRSGTLENAVAMGRRLQPGA